MSPRPPVEPDPLAGWPVHPDQQVLTPPGWGIAELPCRDAGGHQPHEPHEWNDDNDTGPFWCVGRPLRQWRLDLPYPRPPLSLNDRLHWAARARLVDQIRTDVGWLVRQQKVPRLTRAVVQLHYQPRSARRRDPDNLTATSKPCLDGLVDAGVLADDTPEHVEQLMPAIHPTTPRPESGTRLWLTIQEAGR